MAMTNCFLLPRHVVEDSRFRASTARERLYLLWVMSEFALHGPFYRADLEVAVVLAMSVAKARQARRYFAGLGWVVTKPGCQSGDRNLATRYLDVPFARVMAGEPAAHVHAFAFRVLLHRVRQKELLHSDLLLYLILEYVRPAEAKEDEAFEIGKGKLSELCALPGALRCVQRLHKNFRFDEGIHLFEYEDQPDRLLFTRWAEFADPSEAKEAQEEEHAIANSVKREVQARKDQLLRKNRAKNKDSSGPRRRGRLG